MKEIENRMMQDCRVRVPGSKSYTHRALIAAALSAKPCRVYNPLISRDTQHTAQALREMNIRVDDLSEAVLVSGREGLRPPRKPIDLENSGTSMRLLAGLAVLCGGPCVLTGSPRMQERPMQELLDALVQIDVNATSLNANGCPPVRITGGTTRGGRVRIDCSKSSQFLSALMLIAPRLDDGLHIAVSDGPVSKPYIDLTIEVMTDFGIVLQREGYEIFKIPGDQTYCAEQYRVEPDCSQAGYFWAAGAIGGRAVKVLGTRRQTRQGDIRLLDLLEEMGCRILEEPDGITVRGDRLQGITADMSDIPDLVPTMAVVAAFAEGRTTIQNVSHLKVKESDRLGAVVAELHRTGVNAGTDGQDLWIQGGTPHAADIRTYDDHRIAMSFALTGIRTQGIRIQNPQCVEKSFPDFWQMFDRLFAP